jgi:hypothetical protein
MGVPPLMRMTETEHNLVHQTTSTSMNVWTSSQTKKKETADVTQIHRRGTVFFYAMCGLHAITDICW